MASLTEPDAEHAGEGDGSPLTHDELRRLVQAGIDSGSGVDATEAFSRLRAKFERLQTG